MINSPVITVASAHLAGQPGGGGVLGVCHTLSRVNTVWLKQNKNCCFGQVALSVLAPYSRPVSPQPAIPPVSRTGFLLPATAGSLYGVLRRNKWALDRLSHRNDARSGTAMFARMTLVSRDYWDPWFQKSWPVTKFKKLLHLRVSEPQPFRRGCEYVFSYAW